MTIWKKKTTQKKCTYRRINLFIQICAFLSPLHFIFRYFSEIFHFHCIYLGFVLFQSGIPKIRWHIIWLIRQLYCISASSFSYLIFRCLFLYSLCYFQIQFFVVYHQTSQILVYGHCLHLCLHNIIISSFIVYVSMILYFYLYLFPFWIFRWLASIHLLGITFPLCLGYKYIIRIQQRVWEWGSYVLSLFIIDLLLLLLISSCLRLSSCSIVLFNLKVFDRCPFICTFAVTFWYTLFLTCISFQSTLRSVRLLHITSLSTIPYQMRLSDQ